MQNLSACSSVGWFPFTVSTQSAFRESRYSTCARWVCRASAVTTVPKVAAVGQAGGVLLTETVRISGLTVALSSALAPWGKDGAVHDPGKILTDLAVTLNPPHLTRMEQGATSSRWGS